MRFSFFGKEVIVRERAERIVNGALAVKDAVGAAIVSCASAALAWARVAIQWKWPSPFGLGLAPRIPQTLWVRQICLQVRVCSNLSGLADLFPSSLLLQIARGRPFVH
jgi:hypothetical protein